MTATPDRPTVLILGGTGEARALAESLLPTAHVISSLAGRVARPRLPVGDVRIGGFGGPEKLAAWLRETSVRCVVDATHPFAERISASAAEATRVAGVPLLRLQRPGFSPSEGDDWRWVDSLEDAAELLPGLGPRGETRVLLTTGRQGLAAFRSVHDAWFLVRCVDPPETADLPPHHEVLLDRGPYTVEGELALIDAHRITAVATKDSGGPLTVAKLEAARTRGLPVVVVRRPGSSDVEAVPDVEAATAWIRGQTT